jgi:hypothetical protein
MANEGAWEAGWSKGTAAAGKGKDKDQGDAKTADKAKLFSYHKGGKVRKTGIAKLRKGEVVMTAAQAKQCAAKKGKSKSGARKRVSPKSS